MSVSRDGQEDQLAWFWSQETTCRSLNSQQESRSEYFPKCQSIAFSFYFLFTAFLLAHDLLTKASITFVSFVSLQTTMTLELLGSRAQASISLSPLARLSLCHALTGWTPTSPLILAQA